MQLAELLKGIFPAAVPADCAGITVTSICSDSRRVSSGCLFVALRGPVGDGAQYIPQAVQKGAAVIVRTGMELQLCRENNTAVLTVPDTKVFLTELLCNFYHDISRRIKVVGITGTNGKTTITYLLESLFNSAQMPCGVIGTVSHRYAGRTVPAKNTTPGLVDIYQYLAEMQQAGCKYCAMEVSSHALEQGRVTGIDFRAAIFTNLTSDHLDYHKTREEYFLAKSRLFTGLPDHALALLNQDDEFSERLLKMSHGQVRGYSVKAKSDFYARDIQLNFSGTRFILATPSGETAIQTPLVGVHNVYNILSAAGVGHFEGLTLAQIKAGIEKVANVPGRLERIEAGQPFTVLVDYAHTEDALKNVLTSLRQVNAGKIILVFGCGGDRDKTKRPLMGRVAGELADFAIITNDNPRSEEPQSIADQIIPGFRNKNFKVILDRQEAIAESLRLARPKDIVLIAGKGHEDYQIFKDRTVPFDERRIVRQCLQEFMKKA